MREIALILRGNIRKSKSAYLGIAIMMFIVSLSLTITLTIAVNTNQRDWKLMDEVGLGHVVAAMQWQYQEEYYEEYEARCEKIADEVRKHPDVERVDLIPTMYVNVMDVNGKKGNSTCFGFSVENPTLHYNLYNEKGELLENFKLQAGEIIVPNSYISLYDVKLGDEVLLDTLLVNSTGESGKAYKIVAFMEDPYMGSSIMGVKTMLFSEEDFRQYQENDYLGLGLTLSVFQKESSQLSDTELETLLNKETAYGSQSWFSFTRTQVNGYMTMLTNIFSAVLVAFVCMIVVATLIVLSHSISSSIELDFVDLGILKAVGVSNKKIRWSILMGYLLAAFVGAVIGIPVAMPLISMIHHLINPTIGLYGDNTPCFGLCALALLAIFMIFTLFILLKLRKLKKVSPVKAISNGREDVHFSSLLKLPIGKKGLKSSLAYRQFSAEKKQYVAAILITAILVWIMVMVTEMCSWFGDGGARLDATFSIVDYHIETYSSSLDIEEEIQDIVYQHDPKAERFIAGNDYVLMDDAQMLCVVCDEPERFHVYKGRTCLYENEIVITEYIVKNYGLDIGDGVLVRVDDTEKEFIITGYFVCANDAGKCIGMHYKAYNGMRKMAEIPKGEETQISSRYHYLLSNPDLAEELVEDINSRYEESEAVAKVRSGFESMDMIIMAVWALAALIYLISGVFVSVTVIMVCSKIFVKEKQDYGIYKAVGFTSKNMRNMFSIRFAIVALVGSILGIILAFLLTGQVISTLFMGFGLYNYESNLNLSSLVLPVIFAAFVYYLVAYLVSKKMKKFSPTVLIQE